MKEKKPFNELRIGDYVTFKEHHYSRYTYNKKYRIIDMTNKRFCIIDNRGEKKRYDKYTYQYFFHCDNKPRRGLL